MEKKRAVGILLLPVVGFVCMVGWLFCMFGEPGVSSEKNLENGKDDVSGNNFLLGRNDLA